MRGVYKILAFLALFPLLCFLANVAGWALFAAMPTRVNIDKENYAGIYAYVHGRHRLFFWLLPLSLFAPCLLFFLWRCWGLRKDAARQLEGLRKPIAKGSMFSPVSSKTLQESRVKAYKYIL